MYTLVLTKQAERSFNRLMKSQPDIGRRVAHALDILSEDPSQGIPLRGDLKGLYKYRVGTYRIIYKVVHSKLIVTVIDIGHRKDIYR